MTVEQLNTIYKQMEGEEHETMVAKGDEYTNDEDRLANFKRNAKLTGMTPIQVWSIYFMKHIDSIMSYVKTGKTQTEDIRLRIMDARNYLALLRCLIEEDK